MKKPAFFPETALAVQDHSKDFWIDHELMHRAMEIWLTNPEPNARRLCAIIAQQTGRDSIRGIDIELRKMVHRRYVPVRNWLTPNPKIRTDRTGRRWNPWESEQTLKAWLVNIDGELLSGMIEPKEEFCYWVGAVLARSPKDVDAFLFQSKPYGILHHRLGENRSKALTWYDGKVYTKFR